jgi:hypothetical protein
MPYTITTNKPDIVKYNGYKYELPNNIYIWTPDSWYETKATKQEQDLIDQYVNLIYDSVKYCTNKETINQLIKKIVSLHEMPSIEFRRQIIDRFFRLIKQMN